MLKLYTRLSKPMVPNVQVMLPGAFPVVSIVLPILWDRVKYSDLVKLPVLKLSVVLIGSFTVSRFTDGLVPLLMFLRLVTIRSKNWGMVT